MRIFISGASGFVGGAVAQRFLALQHEVLCMARTEQAAATISALGAQPVMCDLHSVTASHMAGCEVVVHCAAFVKEWGLEDEYTDGNIVGTANMLSAAKEAGVSRFIHMSSEAAHWRYDNMINLDESAPYADASGVALHYARTKAEAERRVLAASTPTFTTIAISPRMVWGPGDRTVFPALVHMVKQGKFAWIGGGRARTSTTHIFNLVHAVELSLSKGRSGQAYFVCDDGDVSMRDFFTPLFVSQEVTPPTKTVPLWLVRSAASVIERVWGLLCTRSQPPLTNFVAFLFSYDCTVNCSKAKSELGYQPVIAREEGIKSMPVLELYGKE